MESMYETPAAETGVVICETELIQFRHSRIHGTGGYARQAITAGTRLIEYVGERITKAESLIQCEADNVYIFDIDDEFDLNGHVDWNPARFLNHGCAPNCEAEQDEGRIWILALRDIQAGEELTFNYGYGLEDFRDHPCRCGASACVGFIVAEEFFAQLPRQNLLPAEVENTAMRPIAIGPDPGAFADAPDRADQLVEACSDPATLGNYTA